jgi:hypothetical protein
VKGVGHGRDEKRHSQVKCGGQENEMNVEFSKMTEKAKNKNENRANGFTAKTLP